jgi:hypothetical protein
MKHIKAIGFLIGMFCVIGTIIYGGCAAMALVLSILL